MKRLSKNIGWKSGNQHRDKNWPEFFPSATISASDCFLPAAALAVSPLPSNSLKAEVEDTSRYPIISSKNRQSASPHGQPAGPTISPCRKLSQHVPLLSCPQREEGEDHRPAKLFHQPGDRGDEDDLPRQGTHVQKTMCPPDPCTVDEWDEDVQLNETSEERPKKKKDKWWKSSKSGKISSTGKQATKAGEEGEGANKVDGILPPVAEDPNLELQESLEVKVARARLTEEEMAEAMKTERDLIDKAATHERRTLPPGHADDEVIAGINGKLKPSKNSKRVLQELSYPPGKTEAEMTDKMMKEIDVMDKKILISEKHKNLANLEPVSKWTGHHDDVLDKRTRVIGPKDESVAPGPHHIKIAKKGAAHTVPCGTWIDGGDLHQDWMVEERMKKVTEIRDNQNGVLLSQGELQCLERLRRPSQGYVEDEGILGKLLGGTGKTTESIKHDDDHLEGFDHTPVDGVERGMSLAPTGSGGFMENIKNVLPSWLGGNSDDNKAGGKTRINSQDSSCQICSEPAVITEPYEPDKSALVVGVSGVKEKIKTTLSISLMPSSDVQSERNWLKWAMLALVVLLLVGLASYAAYVYWAEIMEVIMICWEVIMIWWEVIIEWWEDFWDIFMDFLDQYPEVIAIVAAVVFMALLATYCYLRKQVTELEKEIQLSEALLQESLMAELEVDGDEDVDEGMVQESATIAEAKSETAKGDSKFLGIRKEDEDVLEEKPALSTHDVATQSEDKHFSKSKPTLEQEPKELPLKSLSRKELSIVEKEKYQGRSRSTSKNILKSDNLPHSKDLPLPRSASAGKHSMGSKGMLSKSEGRHSRELKEQHQPRSKVRQLDKDVEPFEEGDQIPEKHPALTGILKHPSQRRMHGHGSDVRSPDSRKQPFDKEMDARKHPPLSRRDRHVRPASGHAKPTSGHAGPIPGHAKPTSGHARPIPGHAKPTSGHARPIPVQEKPTSGHARPIPGHAKPTSGHAKPTSGHARPMPVHVKPASKHTKPTPGHAKPTSGHARPMPVHVKPASGHAKPTPGHGRPLSGPHVGRHAPAEKPAYEKANQGIKTAPSERGIERGMSVFNDPTPDVPGDLGRFKVRNPNEKFRISFLEGEK